MRYLVRVDKKIAWHESEKDHMSTWCDLAELLKTPMYRIGLYNQASAGTQMFAKLLFQSEFATMDEIISDCASLTAEEKRVELTESLSDVLAQIKDLSEKRKMIEEALKAWVTG